MEERLSTVQLPLCPALHCLGSTSRMAPSALEGVLDSHSEESPRPHCLEADTQYGDAQRSALALFLNFIGLIHCRRP